jgi:hypothetical protein
MNHDTELLDLTTLDPNIRETVRRLRLSGFNTTDSGDGTTKPEDERTMDGPHIIMTGGDNVERAAQDLLQIVRSWGIKVGKQGVFPVSIQADYCPVSRLRILYLFGLTDTMLPAFDGWERADDDIEEGECYVEGGDWVWRDATGKIRRAYGFLGGSGMQANSFGPDGAFLHGWENGGPDDDIPEEGLEDAGVWMAVREIADKMPIEAA